jgi:hypothetical protein
VGVGSLWPVTADAVPVTTVLTDGVNQHPLDAGYESVVDEPQLSYHQLQRCKTQQKIGNPTENCFQFTYFVTTYHPSFVVHW